jgi:hypothetical protein
MPPLSLGAASKQALPRPHKGRSAVAAHFRRNDWSVPLVSRKHDWVVSAGRRVVPGWVSPECPRKRQGCGDVQCPVGCPTLDGKYSHDAATHPAEGRWGLRAPQHANQPGSGGFPLLLPPSVVKCAKVCSTLGQQHPLTPLPQTLGAVCSPRAFLVPPPVHKSLYSSIRRSEATAKQTLSRVCRRSRFSPGNRRHSTAVWDPSPKPLCAIWGLQLEGFR